MKNIYRIIFLLILNSAFSTHNSFSQTAPGIQWQNTIGGNGGDVLNSILQTSDGGYILGGQSTSNISGDKMENCIGGWDYWIVKTDAAGNIKWQNTIGGSNIDVLISTWQTTDGGYILGGWSSSDSSADKTENSVSGFGDDDYWIVKTDSVGNIQWQNTIGGSDDDEFRSMQQTADGGYILGGYSISGISGDKTENTVGGSFDYWIVKTDSVGNIQWQNTIGGSSLDILTVVRQTADGGYILGGYSFSNISGDKTENTIGVANNDDYWIVKTDAVGNIQWQNTIGGSGEDWLSSIQQTTDGGYILGGSSNSDSFGDKTEDCIGDMDYWIVKTNPTGNIQWQNTIGGSDFDELNYIQQTVDGGYILGGRSRSNISGDKTEDSNGAFDYWIVKTDPTGNIQWQNTIGGSDWDWLFTLQQTSEGGYILGGYSESNISGDKTENSMGAYDYWVIKLAPDTITGIPNLQFSTFNFQLTPHPLTIQSKLTFKNPNKENFLFTLYDITGRETESVSTTNNEIILTKGSKPAGVYLFNLVNEKKGERWRGKIIIAN